MRVTSVGAPHGKMPANSVHAGIGKASFGGSDQASRRARALPTGEFTRDQARRVAPRQAVPPAGNSCSAGR